MGTFVVKMYHMLQNDKISEKEFIAPCNTNCSFCFLNYTDVLGKNSLFRNLSLTEIGDTIKNVHHRVKKFEKGDLVAGLGETYNNLHLIVKGAVVGEIIDFEGKVIRVNELKAPEAVAANFLFGENNLLPVNITAKEFTKMLVFSKEDLLLLFHRNKTILENYLNIMANNAQHLSRKLKLFGLHTLKGKIAHYLLDLVREAGRNEIVLPNTQNELSEMFAVARPSVARAMRELHDEGVINAKGKKVQIVNTKELSEFLR